MKPIRLALAIGVFLTGCQTSNDTVPLMTPEAAARGGYPADTLREGRGLFVRRCIECHALPVVSQHSLEAWPHIVAKMSVRADLKPAEREAVTAYLITLRRMQK